MEISLPFLSWQWWRREQQPIFYEAAPCCLFPRHMEGADPLLLRENLSDLAGFTWNKPPEPEWAEKDLVLSISAVSWWYVRGMALETLDTLE